MVFDMAKRLRMITTVVGRATSMCRRQWRCDGPNQEIDEDQQRYADDDAGDDRQPGDGADGGSQRERLKRSM
jgi:hypothetical protein